jgi:diguanylate cyclase (GGDEF)-like protein
MLQEVTPYAALYVITAIIATIVAILAWDRRTVPGGLPLALAMVGVTVWALGSAAEILATDIPSKISWSKICYLGTVSTPVLFLILAAQYNHLSKFLTRRNILLAFVVPAITLALAMTNEWHGLIWNSYTPSPVVKNMIIYGHGPWFWVGAVGYSYLVTFLAVALLVWATIRFPKAYRRQAISLVIGGLVAWSGNLIYILQLSPLPGLELTPIAFTLTGIICAFSIFHLRLLDLVPVARDVLIDTMRDAVLVIDAQHRIVDVNPAACKLFKINHRAKVGAQAEDTLSIWPQLASMIDQSVEGHTEITLNSQPQKVYELSVLPIFIRHNYLTGHLIVLQDITEHKTAEYKLQQMNQRLRTHLAEIESLQIILREQAIRDPLTELYNRRYLVEALDREVQAAQDTISPLSVVMLDMDEFKQFNDTNGHRAADEMLHALGTLLLLETQATNNVACRYGGEEFVIVMPGTALETAYCQAEKWRLTFEDTTVTYAGRAYRSTFSGGVAAYPIHGRTGDELLRAVDKTLYFAKAMGRNRVSCAPLPAH